MSVIIKHLLRWTLLRRGRGDELPRQVLLPLRAEGLRRLHGQLGRSRHHSWLQGHISSFKLRLTYFAFSHLRTDFAGIWWTFDHTTQLYGPNQSADSGEKVTPSALLPKCGNLNLKDDVSLGATSRASRTIYVRPTRARGGRSRSSSRGGDTASWGKRSQVRRVK